VSARPALHRSIGLLHATALVAGIIIGASIFVQPAEITREVPSVGGMLAVWGTAGLLSVAGALICAELASAMPLTGGIYVFLRETLSPALAFLWGWAMFWSIHSGIIGAIAVVFARYVAYFVPLGDTGIRAAAIAAILLVSAVNYAGVKHGSRLQTAFTVVKVLAILLMILAGFTLGSGAPDSAGGAGDAPGSVTADGVVRALIAGLFAFGGWHMVTYSAGETRDPERTIPRALAIGMAVVILCYVLLNAAYLYVLPLERVMSSTRVAADAADALLGSGGGALMSSLVIFSTFGALGGLILSGPRVYHAMAHDGTAFRWLGEVHPRFRTPHRAIALQAVWSCVLVATGTYRALFTRVIHTEWIFFGLLAVGLFLARRRAGYRPAYRVWGYPVVPAIFLAASMVIVVNQVVTDPRESAVGLGFVAIGLPVYALWARTRPRTSAGVPTHAGDRLP